MNPQDDFLATRLMFCALALGDNLDVDSDRDVRQGLVDPSAGEYSSWVTNIFVGAKPNGVVAFRGFIMGIKGCP